MGAMLKRMVEMLYTVDRVQMLHIVDMPQMLQML